MSYRPQNSRAWSPLPLALASILGASAVIFGAMGAHALDETLRERGTLDSWKTAADYHLAHALALLALGALLTLAPLLRRLLLILWTGGTVLFSGSIYWLALGGPGWLGPVTPLGGLSLIAGWVLLGVIAVKELKSSAKPADNVE